MKVLFLGPAILSGTGGEVIRKRNYNLLKEYFGDDNFCHLEIPFFALYPCFEKDEEIKQSNSLILNNLLKTLVLFKPDIVYLDNSLIYIPKEIFNNYKTIVFYHNIETNYIRQQAINNNIDNKLIDCVYENEKYITENASIRICINQRDSNELKRLFNKEADYILPISFEDVYQKTETNNDEYMLFIGSDFFGNTEGLFWFIENCLDDINIKLLVIGKGMEKYQAKYQEKNVTFLKAQDDLSYYYQNSSLVIEPIISGSGMKTKTAEALMYGKKIFGTNEAFEGYKNINEAEVCVCNNKEEFVEGINGYLSLDNSKYLESSRNYFLNNYENTIVKKKYFKYLDLNLKKIPLLSICIPVYNAEKYLKECLDPLVKMNNVEIILSNDGSTDNSLNICLEYQNNHSNVIVLNNENSGQSIARNRAVEIAKGKYISFVDADDYLETRTIDFLNEIDAKYDVDFIQFGVVSEFEDHSYKADLLYPNSKLLNEEEYQNLFSFICGLRDGRRLSNKYFGLASCKIYKRDVVKDVRFVSNIVGEDTLYSVEAGLKVKSAYFLSERLYHYRVASGTYSHSVMKEIIPKSIRMLEKMKEFLDVDNLTNQELKDAFYFHVYDKYKWCLSALNYYQIKEPFYRNAIIQEIFNNKIYKDMLTNLNRTYLDEREKTILDYLKEEKYQEILDKIFYYD